MQKKPPSSPVYVPLKRVQQALAVAVVGLVVLGALAYVLYPLGEAAGSGGVVEIAKRLDMDHEINLPTWFSSSLLLVCSLTLAAITVGVGKTGGKGLLHWGLLAAIFMYLSIDETANLHELMIVPLRRRLGLGGFLYFAWVIPGAMIVGALGLAYLRFLWRLDATTRWRFIYAGCIYVGGALGMEMIGGAMADWHGFDSIRYITVMMAEETLEMLGLIIFLTALLAYFSRNFCSLQWRFETPSPATTHQ